MTLTREKDWDNPFAMCYLFKERYEEVLESLMYLLRINSPDGL